MYEEIRRRLRADGARHYREGRTCGPASSARRLDQEARWIEKYHQLWDARFDELDKVVEELKRKERVDGRKSKE